MTLSIKKIDKIPNSGSLILIGNKKSNWKGFGLKPNELKFINSQIKNDNKLILINRFNKFIFIQVIDSKKENYQTNESARKAGADILSDINSNNISSVTIIDLLNSPEISLAFSEGIALANYQFHKYLSKIEKVDKHTLKAINIISKNINHVDINTLKIILSATNKSRDLVNEPVSFLTATKLSSELEELGNEAGIRVEVLNKAKIGALKMGGLLAVNLGSIHPPTFTIMEWKPENAINKKPYVLVGKGVVYDTGGLSLKPTPDSMDYMKCDMAGAASVACALYAVAKSKLPLHIIALIPATDNRPGGNAYVPGDVITMHNGLTVEVLNTDAEGRLILADALSYAQQFKPELVIDVATLTGAAAIAIGQYGIVMMGTAGDEAKKDIIKSGFNTYERLVEFPFWDEYAELIKSDIADIKNVGGKAAGSITAGKFLEKFTKYPWIHLDIAGAAFIKFYDNYKRKNATGMSVRLLYDFFKKKVENHNEQK